MVGKRGDTSPFVAPAVPLLSWIVLHFVLLLLPSCSARWRSGGWVAFFCSFVLFSFSSPFSCSASTIYDEVEYLIRPCLLLFLYLCHCSRLPTCVCCFCLCLFHVLAQARLSIDRSIDRSRSRRFVGWCWCVVGRCRRLLGAFLSFGRRFVKADRVGSCRGGSGWHWN